MNGQTESVLKDVLAAEADLLDVTGDPWTGFARRERRHRNQRRAGLAGVAAVLAAAGGVQAGVVPVTWQQVLLEWQRDWARKKTYDATIALVQERGKRAGTVMVVRPATLRP